MGTASGQQFLTFSPARDGTAESGSARAWEVEVDHQLVRSDPPWIDLTTPDGQSLRVERTLFEDRGGGNAMWVGRYPEHDYDSVVLTLQDGHLLGHFGLPDGGTLSIRHELGRTGRMSRVGSAPVACGGGIIPERNEPAPASARSAVDPAPDRVASETNHDRLDVLLLYTPSAARALAQNGYGPPSASMQQAADYLALAFRNSRIPLRPHVIARGLPEAEAAELERADDLNKKLRETAQRRRIAHQADIVHLFANVEKGHCGRAYQLEYGYTAARFSDFAYGYTVLAPTDPTRPYCMTRDDPYHLTTFAHEIGHNLGAAHNPEDTDLLPSELVAPYAYGHRDQSRTPNIRTLMSYGRGVSVPFFSNVHARPDGAVLGIAGERENARALQQSIYLGVRYSDVLPTPPRAPTDVSATATNSTTVRVTWRDRSHDEDGFMVWSRLEGAAWEVAVRTEPNVDEAYVQGLRPGGRYQFLVRAWRGDIYQDSDPVNVTMPGGDRVPDLVVEAPRATETSLGPRGPFRFAATVRNSGDSPSDATTLRYYRSSDSRITTSDAPIGTDPVSALSVSGTDRQNIGQRAPSTPGTYYYGACVDSVSGETNTTNNCSEGVRVTVTGTSAPDLIVEAPRSTETSLAPRGPFRFAATVRNSGESRSAATTLRYYRSADSRITTSDTPIGTDPVSALSASGTDRQNIGQRAPSTPGTYYYGACVDSVYGESDTTNNCSIGVPITVAGATASCSGDTCLLQGERFRVKARYSKAGAPSQSAGAVEAVLADSAGLFSGESDGPELLVRIVNRCRTTGYWEAYAGVASDADFSVAVRHVETNELKWFRTRDRQSIIDTEAFACTRSDDRASPPDPVGAAGGAACSGVTCLLQDDRFRVKSWYAHEGGSSQAADAIAVDLGESAGLFAFDSGNPELLVRIADSCSAGGYRAVYAGTASDADFSVAIRDTETNQLKWFRSQGGQSVADAGAFSCDHGDTFADATSVAVPSTTAGELEKHGDHDYFRLVIDGATTLTVETTGSTDTYGTLFDASEASLESDDDDGASLNFKIERDVEAGTYYVRVRGYAPTTMGKYELHVSTSGGGGSSVPDLVVQSPSVNDTTLTAGQSFTLRATVRNQGGRRSASTTLRYYRSSNSTISTSDTHVGTEAVSALAASGSSAESISLTAPSSAGTYYYGACVDSVSGESSTGNNCSQGVRVTVSGGGGSAFTINLTRCTGNEVSSGTWNMTIGGSVRANQSVRNVTATGDVQPGTRRVGSQFLGNFAVNQTKNLNITGTVSGARPTRCEVEVRGTRGNAKAEVLRLSVPLEGEEGGP
ncbi:MAG: M12 family metallo-peptidase [Acidobacteria bacterium]|nr:M12 family metallo-peptidase [Acidobacteriota bacterium]